MAPCDWCANWNWLSDAKAYVVVKACLHIILPVHGDRDGGVMGNRLGVGVHYELHRATGHHEKWLALAYVEGACFVVFQQTFLDLLQVVLHGWEWGCCWWKLWYLASGALAWWCEAGSGCNQWRGVENVTLAPLGMGASPMVGNLLEIMPKVTQACLDRNNLSDESAKYTICWVSSVSPEWEVPQMQRARALQCHCYGCWQQSFSLWQG